MWLEGFLIALRPINLLYLMIGNFIGLIVGVLPAVGPAFGVALMLPFFHSSTLPYFHLSASS